MKKIAKGRFGYLPAQFRREVLKTILLFASSLTILLLGMVISRYWGNAVSWADSKKNFLTVAAVLGLLPASRSLISAIMFGRAKKYSCPEALWQALPDDAERQDGLPLFCADLFFTAYDAEFPVYVMAATENELIGLLHEKADAAKAQEHIRDALQKDGQKNVTVKLYQDREKFLERVSAAAHASRADKAAERAAARMAVALQISL